MNWEFFGQFMAGILFWTLLWHAIKFVYNRAKRKWPAKFER